MRRLLKFTRVDLFTEGLRLEVRLNFNRSNESNESNEELLCGIYNESRLHYPSNLSGSSSPLLDVCASQ